MKQAVEIRLTNVDDFDQLYALWKETGLDVAPKETEWYEFDESLRVNPTTCFVATVDGVTVGSSLGLYSGRRAFITHLAVTKPWQHHGIGAKLLQATEQALTNVGARALRLYVGYDNLEVIPFYTKSGYTSKQDAILLGKTVGSII